MCRLLLNWKHTLAQRCCIASKRMEPVFSRVTCVKRAVNMWCTLLLSPSSLDHCGGVHYIIMEFLLVWSARLAS